MTIVYVDSVFVLNTLMDYLLLLMTARLSGLSLRRGRYFLAAAAGGVYAVSVFLPGCGFLAGWSGKLIAGLAMALIAFGGQQRFLRLALLLFALSCGLAGCVLGFGLLAGQEIPMARGIFYTNINAKILLAAAAAAYLTITVVFRASARHHIHGTLLPAQIAFCGKRAEVTALCDTGNTLADPMTGRPVLIAEASRVQELWPKELSRYLKVESLREPSEVLRELSAHPLFPRFRLVPYRAVGVSGGLLLAFRSDWTDIGKKRYEKLLVALSPTELGGTFNALWGEQEGESKHGRIVDETRKAAEETGPSAQWRASLHRGERFSAASAPKGAGGRTAGTPCRSGRPEKAD